MGILFSLEDVLQTLRLKYSSLVACLGLAAEQPQVLLMTSSWLSFILCRDGEIEDVMGGTCGCLCVGSACEIGEDSQLTVVIESGVLGVK